MYYAHIVVTIRKLIGIIYTIRYSSTVYKWFIKDTYFF